MREKMSRRTLLWFWVVLGGCVTLLLIRGLLLRFSPGTDD